VYIYLACKVTTLTACHTTEGMLWSELSHSELRILLALPRAKSYSDVAKATGLAPSYVSGRVRRLAAEARLRFWADYRLLGLSACYLVAKFEPRAFRALTERPVPYVRSAARVWDREGAKLLIEANPPLGLEEEFAASLSLPLLELWVKRREGKFAPLDGALVELSSGRLKTKWSGLPERAAPLEHVLLHAASKPPRTADAIDLLILREREEFCFLSLSEVGRRHGLSQQAASYHYRAHLKGAWVANCIEHRGLSSAVLYRVEAEEPIVALRLLLALREAPSLVDAFVPAGRDEELLLVVDESLEGLADMHRALLSVEGVRRAELIAFFDPRAYVHHGLTAHLGLTERGWSLEGVGGLA